MIIERKNKFKQKTKKNFLVLGLILTIFAGLFGIMPANQAHAQASNTPPPTFPVLIPPTIDLNSSAPASTQTNLLPSFANPSTPDSTNSSSAVSPISTPAPITGNTPPAAPMGWCTIATGGPAAITQSTKTDCGDNNAWSATDPSLPPPNNGSPFQQYVDSHGCGFGVSDHSSLYPGCFVAASYGLFYVIPSLILFVSAYFFNVLISITLGSSFFSNSFLPVAWAVVRDLSNLFFILVLLYIAINLILGLGGHGTKEMIGKVIIAALLINFSMFFTEVVIDSSNILALIFYNKMNVSSVNANGGVRPYESASGEKDVAGGMDNAFDPTRILTDSFFNSTTIQPIPYLSQDTTNTGNTSTSKNPPPPTPEGVGAGIIIGITIIAGVLMFFASYCFIVAGLSFVGRMIELFILIVFSPFAFMSFSVPKLKGITYIGWDKWIESLLTASFMAPIFMFFLYFIFLLIKANIFSTMITTTNQGFIEKILLVVLPAVLILILLLKATEYAKKGSGQFGEYVMKGAKMVGGLALGAATGGVAALGTGLVGGYYQKVANNDELRRKAAGGAGVTKEERKSAERTLARANSMANKSFDFRQTGIGKFAAKKSGMDFNSGPGLIGLGADKFKGGAAAGDKRKAEKNEAIRKSYEMTPAAAEKQDQRNKDYKKDKIMAEQTMQNMDSSQLTAWEEKYKKELGQNKLSLNPVDEKTFRENYEKDNPVPPKSLFDEKKFKEAYEKGGDLKEYGLNKEISAGSIGNHKEVNDARREAQAWHMEHPTSSMGKNGEEIKGLVRGLEDFGRLFKEGMKEMTMTQKGMATTAALGVGFAPLTAGLSLVAAPFIGGVLHAVKTALHAETLNRTSENSKIHKMLVGDPNLAATLRKGVSSSQKIIDILKDIEGGDKKVAEELKHVAPPTTHVSPPTPSGNAQGSGKTP